MTREWDNNEDAGDARMMGAADASEFADHCDDCGEHLEDCPCGTDPGEYPAQNRDIYREIETLCGAGKRIAAIKLARNVLGYGLRDAKEYVDHNFPR